MRYKVPFTQGNGQIEPVTIDTDTKKKFGSFGNMWVVSFDIVRSDGQFTRHFMSAEQIYKATGLDMRRRNVIIKDANSELWVYYTGRVYHLGAEVEFLNDGIDPQENGYQCFSFNKAIKILTDDGYMGEFPI